MARRSDRQRQNSPVSAILYAVAIVALAACIVGLVYYSRTQRKEEAKHLSELAREESLQQEELPNEQTEAESESTAELQEETEPSATESGSSTAADNTSAAESDRNENSSEEDTEAAAATAGTSASGTSNSSDAAESASASVSGRNGTSDASEPASSDSTTAGNKGNQAKETDWKQDNILVLNGTGTSGVAGYWKGVCEDAGCEHVAAATYRGTIEPHTVVYAEEGIDAQGIKDIFPDAEIRTGSVTENIIAADSQNYQIWIVVGKQDARNH